MESRAPGAGVAPHRPSRLPGLAPAALALAALAGAGVAAAQPEPPRRISATAAAEIRALQLDKATWSPAERKLDGALVFALKRRRGDALLSRLPALRTGRELARQEAVEVEIVGAVDPPLEEAVAEVGTVLSVHPERSLLRARVPLERLLGLAARPDVRSIRRDLGFEVRKDTTSEGDVAHLASLARATFGVDGSGVAIGVLSNGIDTLAARQATGDLPAVNVLPGQAGVGDEGTAMLEIVHDLAPGATLWYATALGGEAQFAANVAALAAAGCDVIVDDVFYFAEATFQDDLVAQAVNDFTAAGGLYFSSAGNSGNLSDGTSGVWEGDFDSAATDPAILAGRDTHDFGAGSANEITGDSPSFFILQWADPLGGSANDYDLYLLDPTGATVFAAGEAAQDGDDDPLEAISSASFDDAGNLLAIVRFSGAARFLWLSTHRGRLDQATSGQTSGHATAAEAFGVAAVDWSSAGGAGGAFDGSESVETFSSDGPRRIFFASDGTPLTPGDFSSSGGVVRRQPRIAGADGVSTSTPGFGSFFGTSAAAPHVAAVAALVRQQAELTPAGFDQLLAATALDVEAAGFDRDSGHGIAQALAVVAVTAPAGVGGTPPACALDHLTLTGTPNDGPATFRACASITAAAGRFDDVVLVAHDTTTGTPGTIALGDGFASAGPLALRTTAP
ncbi:MAG TPA: S8 family serine peptidase [Thermoanaerobaculia bacterium]|nr:S8 family serine peptidase [Thermoanaerobaculia bacterium]